MAISFVGAGAVQTGASPSVPVPAGYAAGDLLLIVCESCSGNAPGGWTFYTKQTGGQAIGVYYKFAGSSEGSVTVYNSDSLGKTVMLAYRGAALGSYSTFATGTSTAPKTNSVTTTFANSYVVSVFGCTYGAAVTFTAPASTTQRVNSSAPASPSQDGLLIVDELQAAAGASAQRTATLSVSRGWSAWSFVLRPTGTLYWVGGNGTWNSTATANWAASSGGAGGAGVPSAQDDVVIDANSGTGNIDGTTYGNYATCKNLTVTTSNSLSLSCWYLRVYGSVSFPAGGNFSATSCSLTFYGSASGRTLAYNGHYTNYTYFQNTGTVSLSQNTTFQYVSIDGGIFNTAGYSVTAARMSMSSGTLTLNASAVSIGAQGWGISGGTLNAGTSTITCDGSSSFTGGNATYYNVAFINVGMVNFSGSNTFNTLSLPTGTVYGSPKTNFAAGTTQTINSLVIVNASPSAPQRRYFSSNIVGTAATLNIASVTNLTDIDFQDITITGAVAPVSGTRLGNAGGNTGITFPAPKTVYMRTSAGAPYWTDAIWAATSGGSANINNFPLAQDTAVIDNSTTSNNVWIHANGSGEYYYLTKTLDTSSRSTTFTFVTNSATRFYFTGNVTFSNSTVIEPSPYGSGYLGFIGRASQTLTSNGSMLRFGRIYIESLASVSTVGNTAGSSTAPYTTSITLKGGLTLGGNVSDIYSVEYYSGDLSLAGYTLSCNYFYVYTGVGTVTFNGGTISVAGGFDSTNGSKTWSAGTSVGKISMTSASAKTFAGAGYTYSGCTLENAGAGALTISGSNTFYNITNSVSPATFTFTAGTTQTVTTFTASGTSGNLVTIQSSSAGSPATLSSPSGAINVNYCSIKDSTATGGATWNAYTSSGNVNVSGNTGWIFTAPLGVGNGLFFGSNF